jgi:hypothetical protein
LYTSKYVADVEGLGDIMKNRCEQLTQSRKENPAIFHAKMYQIGHYFGVRLLQLCTYRDFATSFVSHQSKILKTKSSNISDRSMPDNMDDETCSDEAEYIHYEITLVTSRKGKMETARTLWAPLLMKTLFYLQEVT